MLCPFKIFGVKCFHHGFQSGLVAGCQNIFQFPVCFKKPDNDQDGRCRGGRSVFYLQGIGDEILAQQGETRFGHDVQIGAVTLEPGLFREHGHGGGSCPGIHGSHFFGTHAHIDFPFGRGGPFVLGDDGPGCFGCYGLGKSRFDSLIRGWKMRHVPEGLDFFLLGAHKSTKRHDAVPL